MYQSGREAIDQVVNFGATYRSVLRNVDPMDILRKYNAKNIHYEGNKIIHSCLLDQVNPHHSHGDENASAVMFADTLSYNCWSYGGGSILWFIQEMEGVNSDEALNILAELMQDRWDNDSYSIVEYVKSVFKERSDQQIPVYSKVILRPWLKIHPYLTEERGISETAIQRLRLGYDEDDDKIVIPHFWKGDLVGWQKRRLPTTPDEPGNPKYKSSTDFPRRTTLYNYDRVVKRGHRDVVVVESPMSVAKAETFFDLGATHFGNVVGSFGAAITNQQLEYLKNFDSVTVYFDADAAGYKGALKAYNQLKNSVKVFLIPPLTSEDLSDLDLDRAEGMMGKAKLGALIGRDFSKKLEEIRVVQKVQQRGESRGSADSGASR